MKKILLLLFITTSVFAQKSVNDYKYVIVPKQYNGFKKADQYQTSSLIKFLLKKNNFNVFFDDESLPADLVSDRCKALTADLFNDSGIFVTKVQIRFKDCFNKEVYSSKFGKSKLKEYKKAYHKAIREAFNSIKQLNYKYVPKTTETIVTKNIEVSTERERNYNLQKEDKVVEVKQTSDELYTNITNVLYAQPKDYGYQLINDVPEVVFKLLKTNRENSFIIKDKNGTFSKKSGDVWSAEYYENDKLVTKLFRVKF
ncbi:hypothetical protein [Tenacibaculum jejuense]|uniref:Secreted protein n=1 Tax=Tenacibaculum jejuense TaxID=584609 RepID=A0A238UDG2_9FLAO|nr:hypothetical protein [Tenacibaculum jejuense]SNR17095.1 conserved protein of unknown function [Tenacibaculum jejuense]